METLDTQKMLLLFGVSLVFVVFALFLFEKRDLRFGGSIVFRLVFSKKGGSKQ